MLMHVKQMNGLDGEPDSEENMPPPASYQTLSASEWLTSHRAKGGSSAHCSSM